MNMPRPAHTPGLHLAVIAFTFAVSRPAGGQSNASVHPVPPVVANAVTRTGPIVIDGKLDEDAWKAATPIAGFRQLVPNEGAAATYATEVRFLYDGEALYIGARMAAPAGGAGIRAPLARRDQLLDANGNNGSFNSLTTDKLVVVLDPYHNHIDQVLFEVNPAGVRGDSFNGDDAWDPVWEAATSMDANGWTAEMRIPFSQLRFRAGEAQEWGMQVWRYADARNERDMWAVWGQKDAGGPGFFGHLEGLRIPTRPRSLELLPYAVTKGTFAPVTAGDPFHRSSSGKLSAGADVKYLLTSNLTLNATINPDFGQVEVDPASLNLSAYETFYEEKRPFFVGDQSAFAFGGMSCMFCSNSSSLDVFYTRRIGRPPQLNGVVQGRSTFADLPDNAAILGAAKITGRTASGYTIGVLDALTNRQTAHFVTAPGAAELTQEVEPLANYFVGRVSKELRQGSTTIGAIVTSTLRNIGSDSIAANRLRDRATAIGLDWRHTWHQRAYEWRGSAALSDIGGSAPAIAAAERSSAHYFQRPDREITSDGLFDTSYDTTATVMRGYGFYTRLAKRSGSWLWETAQNWRSPGFEVNDLSFLSQADFKWMNFNVARQWSVPTRWYRSMIAIAGGQLQFNYDGLRTDEQAQAYYSIEFPNYWRIRSFTIIHPSVYDDRLTRGGPVVVRDGYKYGQAEVSTDARRRAVFDVNVSGSTGVGGPAKSFSVSPGLALKPAANVFIQVSPTANYDETTAQYVTAIADPTAVAFGGTRYVFSYIRTRILSLDTRINWTFSPALTLQVFAQPFFASGDYREFREFAAPKTARKLDYGTDIGTISYDASAGTYTVDPDGAGPAAPFTFANPNFSARSLRGTAVLRWEYRPGSTIFFAWTQERSGASADGSLDFARDRSALFRDPAHNVFVVKMNWWIGG